MRVIDNKISAMITKGLNKEKFDRKLSKRDRVVSDGYGKVRVILWKTEIAVLDGISQRKWVWYIDEVCPLTRDRKSKKFQGLAAFPLKIWK